MGPKVPVASDSSGGEAAKKRKKRAARPLKLDAVSRARRRHKKRRHPASAPRGHHKRMHKEAELMNYLLHQVLKTAASTERIPRGIIKGPPFCKSSMRVISGLPLQAVLLLQVVADRLLFVVIQLAIEDDDLSDIHLSSGRTTEEKLVVFDF